MITDNDFSEQELTAAIAAKPELLDSVVKKVLTAKEYNVRSKDEETTYVSNLEQQHTSKFVSKFAKELEDEVKTSTGLEKTDANEKYFDYNKRALKTLSDERKALKAELDTLKGTSDISKFERDQLEDLKGKVSAADKKIKDLETSKVSEVSRAKMENEIVRQMNTVPLAKSTIKGVETAKEIMSNQVFEEINKIAQKDTRGQIILVEGDKALTNADGSFKTVAQFYNEKMSDAGFVDNGKNQGGAGGERQDVSASNIPGGCKTQVELTEWLRNNTMKGNTERAPKRI